MFVEFVFFCLAVVPRWYTSFTKNKNLLWWWVFTLCCGVWLIYYTTIRPAPAGVLNVAIELLIGCYGIYRIHKEGRGKVVPFDCLSIKPNEDIHPVELRDLEEQFAKALATINGDTGIVEISARALAVLMRDRDMLNFLEEHNRIGRYSRKCVFRMSETGRGWRLHETDRRDGSPTVRMALANAMESDL